MQSKDQRHFQFTSSRLEELARYHREFLRSNPDQGAAAPLHDVFTQLQKGFTHSLPFDHLTIGLFDPSENSIKVLLQAGPGVTFSRIPVLENSLGTVLHRHQAIEVRDTETEESFPDLIEHARSEGFRSFRVVPLAVDHQALGALAIARKQPSSFSHEEAQQIDHAGRLIGLVLQNAIAADANKREKIRLQTLLDANNILISSLDPRKMFKELSALMRRLVGQDQTYISLYDKSKGTMQISILEEDNDLVPCTPLVVPISESPAGICYQQGESMQFKREDLERIGSEHTKTLSKMGIRTISCFLLANQGRKFGVLGLANETDRLPASEDVVLLSQIAGQLGMALDNAHAYEEIASLKDRLSKEKSYLEEELRAEHNFGEVIGNSPALCQVLKEVEIAAPSDATVLLLGETGTGKELVARALHRLSSRHDGNFIKLNCAAIPTGLLESELFGHEKGAFTGAVSQKIGRLELADKGTLFLDEIGEIPTELQPKLLRVLQDQEFERLGGVKTIKVSVRVVAATNRDLGHAVEEHEFRRDLFYRLSVFPIRLPALRERRGDIPLLVRYFVKKFAHRMGKNIESIPIEVMDALEQWHWPGNIRELENFLERSVILTQGTVLFAPLAELRVASPDRNHTHGTLEQFEREYIVRALRECKGVIAGLRGAAARLGMKRSTLQSRMQKLGISRDEYAE